MTAADDRIRAHALVDDLLGASDARADRAVAVLHAHAVALSWVRDTMNRYPAPRSVAARLDAMAERLRTGADTSDPMAVLTRTAMDAVAEYRATTAA